MLDVRSTAFRLTLIFAILAFAVPASPVWGQSSDPPPRSDTITALTQFLVCSGNPYALCYYSGPERVPPGTKEPVPRLPCTLEEDGKVAKCKCYALEDGTSTNYVALPSILDPDVRNRTEEACGEDGKGCLNMINQKVCEGKLKGKKARRCKTAPVCRHLGNVEKGRGQSLYPKAVLISTFSFEHASDYPINSTDCTEKPYVSYAGCMTAPCGEPYSEDGERLVDCSCPTYLGPFQFGQKNPALQCELKEPHLWSAANLTVSIPAPE